MKRLDIHVHCDSTDKAQLDYLADVCRKQNTIAALSGGLRYGGHDFAPNETVVEICKQYPDCFVPLAKLDLWETADPSEVYKYAEMGVKGFKAIYPYYEYDHDIYMPVYEAAEKCGLPILFHTGKYAQNEYDKIYRRPMLRNMHPICLDRIARSFQDLKLVMAHLGTRYFQPEATQFVQGIPNVYGDMGGNGQWKRITAAELVDQLGYKLVEVDRGMEGFRKLVLGSDAYVTYPHLIAEAQKYYTLIMERAGVPEDIFNDIMGGTVAKWMGIELND